MTRVKVPAPAPGSQGGGPPQAVEPADDLHKHVPADTALAQYVTWATADGGLAILHLASALVFAAHTLARRGFVLKLQGETVHPTLWVALVTGTGTGKTTAIDRAADFQLDVSRETGLGWKDPFVEPTGSIPGVFTALQDHYDEARGTTVAILHHDELSAVLATKEPIGDLLCQLHDCRTVSYHTKTARKKDASGGAEKVVEPRISALFASNRAQLGEQFRESHRIGGLFPRVQWVQPAFKPEHRRTRVSDPSARAEHTARRQEAVVAWANWEGQLSALAGAGTEVLLEPAALEYIEHAFGDQLWELTKDGDSDNMHGTYMRLLHRTYVLATLFALSRQRLVVELEDAKAAVELARGLNAHLQAATDLGADPKQRLAKLVTGLVLAAGEQGLPRRDIYTHARVTKMVLSETIETLTDAELVIESTSLRSRKRLYHVSTAAGQRAFNQKFETDRILAALHPDKLPRNDEDEDEDDPDKPN